MKTESQDACAAGAGARSLAVSRGARLRHRVHPIAIAGLLAGVLDIFAAFAFHGTNGVAPARVLQAIASGALGPAAFAGGRATAALGLLLHFLIAVGAAAVFYLASRGLPMLLQRPIIAGVAYGVLVYGVMNRIVVPLSRLQAGTPPWSSVAILVAIHILFVGLPISLTMARAARGTESPPAGAPTAGPTSGDDAPGKPPPRRPQPDRRRGD